MYNRDNKTNQSFISNPEGINQPCGTLISYLQIDWSEIHKNFYKIIHSQPSSSSIGIILYVTPKLADVC